MHWRARPAAAAAAALHLALLLAAALAPPARASPEDDFIASFMRPLRGLRLKCVRYSAVSDGFIRFKNPEAMQQVLAGGRSTPAHSAAARAERRPHSHAWPLRQAAAAKSARGATRTLRPVRAARPLTAPPAAPPAPPPPAAAPQDFDALGEGEEMRVHPGDILGYNVDTLRWLQTKAATNYNTSFGIDYVRPTRALLRGQPPWKGQAKQRQLGPPRSLPVLANRSAPRLLCAPPPGAPQAAGQRYHRALHNRPRDPGVCDARQGAPRGAA
jgi:hypothetical protein